MRLAPELRADGIARVDGEELRYCPKPFPGSWLGSLVASCNAINLPSQHAFQEFPRYDQPAAHADDRHGKGFPLSERVGGRAGDSKTPSKLGDRDRGGFM
jgi:hypothetical protein